MEWHVMKERVDLLSRELSEQMISPLLRGQQKVVEMRAVPRTGRHYRPPEETLSFRVGESGLITLPHLESSLNEPLCVLELRPEKGRRELTRREGRAEVDPRVLVHLAAEERAPVCSLLVHDLRSFNELGVVHDECTTLSADDVLHIVEAQGRERSEDSK